MHRLLKHYDFFVFNEVSDAILVAAERGLNLKEPPSWFSLSVPKFSGANEAHVLRSGEFLTPYNREAETDVYP